MHRTRDKISSGINHTLEKTDPNYANYRFFFFETDKPYNQEHFTRIIKTYESHRLDLLIHNTGGGGQHFISPTLITVKEWKRMIDELKDINPRFPALVLRLIPNKYVDEAEVWRKSKVYTFEGSGYTDLNTFANSFELCNLLNKGFGSQFKGLVKTDLKIRTYPLPCIYCNRRKGKNHVCLISV